MLPPCLQATTITTTTAAAIATTSSLTGLEPEAMTYNAAISACEKVAQWQRALSMLAEMEARGVAPNVISYSAAISACEKAGQCDRALELLREMRNRGVAPNAITYNAAISACAAGEPPQWQRALELLEEMGREGTEPNTVSYGAAISACGKGGQWQRALALLDESEEKSGYDISCYNLLMTALISNGQLDEGMKTLERLNSGAAAAELRPSAYTVHRMLLEEFRTAGQLERASEVQKIIESLDLKKLSPEAQIVVNGQQIQHVVGRSGSLHQDVDALCNHLTSTTKYVPRLDAVPFDRAQGASADQQAAQLRLHPEKLALADLLQRGSASLEITINFKVRTATPLQYSLTIAKDR